MLRDRKIALFVDVDNSLLDSEGYERVVAQISEMGEIVCGTVYGASERKHKKAIEQASEKGYLIQQPMRIRRRVRKVFDDRIFVDVTELAQRNSEIDTVAIVSGATDLVYLFAYLRRLGLQVIAADNLDAVSTALASATVELGIEKQSAPKTTVKKPEVIKIESVVAAEKPASTVSVGEDRTEALLREISKLRADYEAVKDTVEEEPRREQPSIVEEAQILRQEMASLQEETAAPSEEPVVQQEVEEQPKEEAPRASYVSQNDSDLIKRIEQLRQNSSDDSNDMVAEIKKLLDGLE